MYIVDKNVYLAKLFIENNELNGLHTLYKIDDDGTILYRWNELYLNWKPELFLRKPGKEKVFIDFELEDDYLNCLNFINEYVKMMEC